MTVVYMLDKAQNNLTIAQKDAIAETWDTREAYF